MIAAQAARADTGEPARIVMKLNNLVDETVIEALYDASRAGVPIDLVVRSTCALRPGVRGMSERIRVSSILGRFLEHSRIYRFGDGEDDEIWLGSPDMMHRNLDRRVEVLVRVDDAGHRARLREILDRAVADPTAWSLRADGSWSRRHIDSGGSLQRTLMRMAALGITDR
jgi:polyphosphate kinase